MLSLLIRALLVSWTICNCENVNVSVSWNNAESVKHESNGDLTSTDKKIVGYRVCRETACLHGFVRRYSDVLLDLEICGLEEWSKTWESESDWDPWPDGLWLMFRHDDTPSYEIFVPWRGLNVDCIQSKYIQQSITEIGVIQLLVADEKGELRGVATDERQILTNQVEFRVDDAHSVPSADLIESFGISPGNISSLTRANFCDLLQHPLILKNSRARVPAAKVHAEISAPDTLILYSFSHSDGWREDNLLFWIARGLLPSPSRYYFVIVFNGEVDPSWRAMLDRVEARMAGSLEWLARPDRGRDVCAWHSVLTGELRIRPGVAGFRRFVLLNGSVRGPFLPAFAAGPWPEVFLAPLDGGDVDLSGVTVNCGCRAAGVDNPRIHGARPAYVVCDSLKELHVQSYLLAFARPALAAALRLQGDVCAGVRDDDPPIVQATKVGVFERGFTQAVLVDGGNLAVTQHLWQVSCTCCELQMSVLGNDRATAGSFCMLERMLGCDIKHRLREKISTAAWKG